MPRKLMPLSLWLIAVFNWTTVAAVESLAPADCRLRQIDSVDLQVGHRVLAPVTIEGHAAMMTLNSTSSFFLLSKSAAESMQLKPTDGVPGMNLRGPHGESIGRVIAEAFSIGRLSLGKTKFFAIPEPGASADGSIGTIGINALLGVDFELDFAHNKLNFFESDHCPGNVVYWTDASTALPYVLDKAGTLVFPMELDGKKIDTSIQISAPKTVLHTDVSKSVYGFDETSPDIQVENSASGKPTAHYRAMKMSAEGLSISNSDVFLVPNNNKACHIAISVSPGHSVGYDNCYGSPPLVLGSDSLRRLRFYFATKEHVLYISAADAGKSSSSEQSHP